MDSLGGNANDTYNHQRQQPSPPSNAQGMDDRSHTASGTRPGVSSLLGLFRVSSAKIVSASMDDDSALQSTHPPVVSLCPSFNQFDQASAKERNSLRTPSTLCSPISLISLSCTEPTALPCPSVRMLPKSPTWRSSSEGAPCVLENGLTERRTLLVVVSLFHLDISSTGTMERTYSEGRPKCIRWCCRQTGGCGSHARRWGRGR